MPPLVPSIGLATASGADEPTGVESPLGMLTIIESPRALAPGEPRLKKAPPPPPADAVNGCAPQAPPLSPSSSACSESDEEFSESTPRMSTESVPRVSGSFNNVWRKTGEGWATAGGEPPPREAKPPKPKGPPPLPKEWKEAVTPGGVVYYWHMTSGETTYERPRPRRSRSSNSTAREPLARERRSSSRLSISSLTSESGSGKFAGPSTDQAPRARNQTFTADL